MTPAAASFAVTAKDVVTTLTSAPSLRPKQTPQLMPRPATARTMAIAAVEVIEADRTVEVAPAIEVVEAAMDHHRGGPTKAQEPMLPMPSKVSKPMLCGMT